MVHRSPACACGGSCPRCSAGHDHDGHPRVSQPGDAYEREADEIAARVMGSESASVVAGASRRHVLRAADGAGTASPTPPATLSKGLQSPSQPLDAATETFMESRFGRDFGEVRVHVAHDAAESARNLRARAFTYGGHIVFGADQYAPATQAGQRLIAHELAHVVQQSGEAASTIPPDLVPREPTISILDENFVGPPSPAQRRAERSCPVDCCLGRLGTLHAMALFYHERYPGAVTAAGSATANGVGTSLHFIANDVQPPAGDICHCDDFRIIQVIETTHPAAGRGGNSYVDNNATNTPFYSDVFLGGRGEHTIPMGWPDAGETIKTTESIYDRPFRTTGILGTTSLSWMAEACVACVKNTEPDRVLGCATYGFTRNYNAATGAFDPVVGVGPGCLHEPSAHFVNTLGTDPTTTSYDFLPAPRLSECFPVGDFPTPPTDTRIA
jgi:hypothetical protein